MSYGLHLAGDAIADLQELDPWLQEEVIDELESLTLTPWRLRADGIGRAVHDFDRRVGTIRHVVFLRLHRDDVNHVLTLVGIIHFPPAAPAP